uniref:putative CENPB DNA-binding domain-containing protein 1 n=1 Tax=Myxine glutinosa TaxID=7769 RepID=UPI00358F7236
MAPKHKTTAGDASTTKRQKKVMSLSQKVELLDWLSRGESAASVDSYYGVNESTVRYIRENEKVIRYSARCNTVTSTKVVTHVQDVHIKRMEKALSIWIDNNVQKTPVSLVFHSLECDRGHVVSSQEPCFHSYIRLFQQVPPLHELELIPIAIQCNLRMKC